MATLASNERKTARNQPAQVEMMRAFSRDAGARGWKLPHAPEHKQGMHYFQSPYDDAVCFSCSAHDRVGVCAEGGESGHNCGGQPTDKLSVCLSRAAGLAAHCVSFRLWLCMQFQRKPYTNLVHKGVHKRFLAFTSEVEAPTELHPTFTTVCSPSAQLVHHQHSLLTTGCSQVPFTVSNTLTPHEYGRRRPARCWPAGAPARDRAPAAG